MNDHERDLLIRHESIRLEPYTDTVGKLTIGIGHNLHAEPISVGGLTVWADEDGLHCSITEELAHEVAVKDMEAAVEGLDASQPGWRNLDEVRQAVVADMAFNLGVDGVSAFRNMWAAIRARDWERAAEEMLNSLWARQVGVRAARLAEMMRTGKWPD